MTRSGLDYKNPVGEAAYQVFKNLCITILGIDGTRWRKEGFVIPVWLPWMFV